MFDYMITIRIIITINSLIITFFDIVNIINKNIINF